MSEPRNLADPQPNANAAVGAKPPTVGEALVAKWRAHWSWPMSHEESRALMARDIDAAIDQAHAEAYNAAFSAAITALARPEARR